MKPRRPKTPAQLARAYLKEHHLVEVPAPPGWPASLPIAGLDWAILYVEEGGDDWYGLTMKLERWILLDTHVGTESMRIALVHEALHAILPMRTSRWSEEDYVTHTAPLLVALVEELRRWELR